MRHEVIRLPSYSCQYIPIELIWAQVKNKVAKEINLKMVNVELLTHQALVSITQLYWKNCVKNSESIQDKDYDKYILRDSLLETILLNLLPDDSDWYSSDNTKSVLNSFV